MASRASRPAGWRRDLLFGFVAFWVVFATIYAVGRAAMPVFRSALGDIESANLGDGESGEVSVVAMRADLAPFERPVALLQASGAVDGRVLLDRGETQGGFFLPDDFEQGSVAPIDVNVRFSGSGTMLTLIADQVPIDQPRN